MRHNLRKSLKGSIFRGAERGTTLVETLVAVALLGIIACAFFGSLDTAARATWIADERTTAESLARSQLEHIKTLDYVGGTTQYPAAPVPSGEDYSFYSANITAELLDDHIQKITVTVKHSGNEVVTLESYKVDR